MGKRDPGELSIQRLESVEQAEACARTIAESEPWITLGRDYDESLTILTDPSREVYLAMDGDEVAGFVALEMEGVFTGYVKSIFVSPPYRGRGVGTRLMSFAEDRVFRERPNVFLCVSDFNGGARRFYERLGYEAVGELRDYIVRGRSEILLRKTIGPLAEFGS
ncbi:MAG TPA: GNAT family N-acetyltransferase [Candidatus Krumholzibacteriaceae bacterium]|nr:GNAT family N-acetyltransferase [Candidatus Krumholzibacteriaceae bacterium]